jgi:hypothetical protein
VDGLDRPTQAPRRPGLDLNRNALKPNELA